MAKQIALASVWGAFAACIFWWVEAPLSGVMLRVAEPAVRSALHSGWSGDQIRPYLLAFIFIVPALLYSFVFGLPLGFLGSGRVLSWLTFVAAFVVTLVVRMLAAQYAVEAILAGRTNPLFWLMALGTLLFMVLGGRLRSSYVRQRAA
jgi:hypothetical protein